MRWAIIDDGVNTWTPELVQNIEIDRNGAVKKREPALAINHATICFRIIQKYADTLHDAVSIKIIDDDTHRGNKDALIAAFRWCMDNSIELIHMSIGTTDPHDGKAVREIAGTLLDRGIIIVAANNNRGVQTFPAYDGRVISVECDASLNDDQYVYTPHALTGIAFRASAHHRLIENGTEATYSANSFAAPLITAKLLNLAACEGTLSYNHAIAWLQENALRIEEDVLFSVPLTEEKPVVIALFISDATERQCLLTVLNKSFAEDGYSSVLVSSTAIAMLETEIISDKLTLKHYMSWATHFYKSDIMLIALAEEDVSCIGTYVDLFVTDDLRKIPDEFHTYVLCTKVKGYSRRYLEIYQSMIKILSEEETSEMIT